MGAIVETNKDEVLTGNFGDYNVARKGSGVIEVWSDDWDSLVFTVDGFKQGWTVAQIEAAVRVYGIGLRKGKDEGAAAKAREIRAALGIKG